MLQRGIILNKQYRIEAAIGRGGFGYVYRARDLLTGETVAIKELLPSLADQPQMAQRFIREARATMNLTHPHIARTYHTFQHENSLYLVMEYLPGGSLAHHLRGTSLPPDTAVSITIILCRALEYAHHHGVIHCDIKPANILFDARGSAHLADFGVAHVSETLMTHQFRTVSGSVLGTMRYMSPEQLEGVRDDPRLDLYALGALLYEMLAGRPYLDFESETTPAAQMRNAQRIQSEAPRPLRAVNPAVPPWLAGVVERALRKRPEERFPSARAMRQALQRRRRRPQRDFAFPNRGKGLSSKERTILIGAAAMVIVVFTMLIALLIRQPGNGNTPTIMAAVSITPTLPQTATPPPLTNTLPPSSLSPLPTSTPTPLPSNTPPLPTETIPPGDPLIPIIQDVVHRYAEIKAIAVGPTHDDSQLPTVLAGKALKDQIKAVQWQRDNGAYYDVTLHWMRYEWIQQTDAAHVRALVTKRETLLYYPRGWATPSAKKSCDCEYQVLYTLELIGGRWYIILKEKQEE